MANVIKFKRGTTANVAKLNGVDLPLLQEGEIAIDITTNTIKVGDGLTAWNNLRGINADTLDSFHASQNADANTVAVRNADGKLVGDILGNSETSTKLKTPRTLSLSGDATGSASFDGSANATIATTVNNAAQAAKLTTARIIALSGDASGSTTFDGSANATISVTVNDSAKVGGYSPSTKVTANTVPVRDANGALPGNITGNAATATKLATARTIALSGDASGSASFDGTANATIVTTVNDSAKVGGYSPSTKVTANTVPVRDANGALPGNITGNAATATKLATARTIALSGDASGSASFDGTANATIVTTVNDSAKVGGYSPSTEATANTVPVRDDDGKLPGDITGNAATATKLATARTIELTGDVRGSTTFDGSTNKTITTVVVDDSHNHTISTITDIASASVAHAANAAKLNNYSPSTKATANTVPVRDADGKLAGDILGNSDTVDGFHASQSIVANNIAVRDADGKLAGDITGNAATATSATSATSATKLATARTIALSGDATGSTTFDGSANKTIAVTVNNSAKLSGYSASTKATANTVPVRDADGKLAGDILGNAATATKLATARTIELTGDVTGSTTFDGSTNKTITTVVADDSHNHTISTITDIASASVAQAANATKLNNYSASTEATANTVPVRDDDGKLAGDILGNAATATKLATARTIELTGDVTGSTTFDGSTDKTITTVVADDSHNHTISTITDIANASVAHAANATKLNNYSPSTTATPSTVPVRDTNGKLAGDILGNADTVDGFHASQSAIPNNIAVRDASGKLVGDITGNAATATNASQLAGLVPSAANEPNTIVVRDEEGNIVGGTIVGQIDSADKVDGFHASQSAEANKVAVRDANGKLPGDVLGHAEATHAELIELSEDVDDVIGFAGYEGSGILGLEWDAPSGTVRRLGAAVGKTGGADFDQYNMYGGRKRCILTDDGVRLAYYGEPGFTETGKLEEELVVNGVTYPIGTPVQVMVEQPVFWYKTVPLKFKKIPGQDGLSVQKIRYYISDTARPGFKRHPAFYTRTPDRKPVDYIYLAAYEGNIYDTSTNTYSITTGIDWNNDKLSSTSNATIKPETITNLRKAANNRGNNWYLMDIFAFSATQLLFAIEYGSFDSQSMIGQGFNGLASPATTGFTSSLGNSSGQAPNGAVTYRGQENLWANSYEILDGINVYADGTNSKAYISYFDFQDSIQTDPYFNVGFDLPQTNGFINAIGWSEICDFMFLPSEATGVATKPLHDFFWNTRETSGYKVFLVGGFTATADNGLFFVRTANSITTWNYARLLYVPTNDPTKLSLSKKTISLTGDVTGSTALDETTNVFIPTTVNNSAKLGGYSPSTTADAETIPVRDSTGKLVGDITGNAATATSATSATSATKLATARTIALSGDATGSTTFDGSANKTIAVTVNNAAKLGGYSASTTATANTVPVRDANGKLPGDITGNAATATSATSATSATKLATARTIALSGDATGSTTFDGSANKTIAVTVNNSAKLSGYSASTKATANTVPVRDANGKLPGDITGNAATATTATTAASATTATSATSAASATKLATARTIALSGDATGSTTFDGSANKTIAVTVNNAAKLGGYSASTTATANTVPVRDANGKLPGDITGNAATATTATTAASATTATTATSATKLTTARTITLTGNVTGSTTFDGSANVSIATTVGDSAKVGGYSPSTTATANTIPVRDANGKLAGDITGNAATATSATSATKLATARTIALSGDATGSTTFDGSANKTIEVTVNNSAKLGGYSASTEATANTVPIRDANGALPGDITGNAATATSATSATSATKLATARTIALSGDATGSTSFDGSANKTIAVTVNNAAKLGGYSASTEATANTVPVRDANGALPGNITGNAATATTATKADKLTTSRTISLTGDVSGSTTFDGSNNATIAATVSNAAKLAGYSPNTSTGANTIPVRNSSGALPGNILGNAATATKLATARTIQLTGDVTGSASFDGSSNVSIATTANVPNFIAATWTTTKPTNTPTHGKTFVTQQIITIPAGAADIMYYFPYKFNSTDGVMFDIWISYTREASQDYEIFYGNDSEERFWYTKSFAGTPYPYNFTDYITCNILNKFSGQVQIIGLNRREEFHRILLTPGPYYLKLRICQKPYDSSFTINLSTRLYYY